MPPPFCASFSILSGFNGFAYWVISPNNSSTSSSSLSSSSFAVTINFSICSNLSLFSLIIFVISSTSCGVIPWVYSLSPKSGIPSFTSRTCFVSGACKGLSLILAIFFLIATIFPANSPYSFFTTTTAASAAAFAASAAAFAASAAAFAASAAFSSSSFCFSTSPFKVSNSLLTFSISFSTRLTSFISCNWRRKTSVRLLILPVITLILPSSFSLSVKLSKVFLMPLNTKSDLSIFSFNSFLFAVSSAFFASFAAFSSAAAFACAAVLASAAAFASAAASSSCFCFLISSSNFFSLSVRDTNVSFIYNCISFILILGMVMVSLDISVNNSLLVIKKFLLSFRVLIISSKLIQFAFIILNLFNNGCFTTTSSFNLSSLSFLSHNRCSLDPFSGGYVK